MRPWPYPFWIAHRGAGKLAPENTLAAFRLGADMGYTMFECDAKLSRDGVVFLLHDATLDRTTSGCGKASDRDWRELILLDAGAWHSPHFAGERLLSLSELVSWCAAHRLLLNVEIKPIPGLEEATGAAVARLLAEQWPPDLAPPLLSSFSPASLVAALEVEPKLPRALLLEGFQTNWYPLIRQVQANAVVAHFRAWTQALVHEVRHQGLRALSYTVNEAHTAQTLTAWGLDGLITDRVDFFVPDTLFD